MNATTTDAKRTSSIPLWSVAMTDIMIRDARPKQAAENLFKRVKAIFANHQILQS